MTVDAVDVEPALRIRCDRAALQANYRWFAERAGVPVSAAVKADAYGTGVHGAVAALAEAGCTSFLVSSWAEADRIAAPADVVVLHGFHPADAAAAARMPHVRPVLNTAAQVAAWAAAFPDRIADIMVETGMNRLGLGPEDLAAAVSAVRVGTIHSHLACADVPDHPMNGRQLQNFRAITASFPDARFSLANSAGVCLGPAWAFDAVRPGIGLFGGRPHPDAPGNRVVRPEARIIQLRQVAAGAAVGYGATWTARRDSQIAIVHIGYADGIVRAIAPHLRVWAGASRCRLAGRISMDMMAVDVTGTDVAEGDYLSLDWDVPMLSQASGVSEYELLTLLGQRPPRIWQ